eukprot:6977387-Pyramimonas_sp.AAC.1
MLDRPLASERCTFVTLDGYLATRHLAGSPQHLLANPASCGFEPSVFPASTELQYKLHMVHAQLFPPQASPSEVPASYTAALDALKVAGMQVRAGQNLLKFHLRPVAAQGVDTSCVRVPLTMREVQEQLARDVPASTTVCCPSKHGH